MSREIKYRAWHREKKLMLTDMQEDGNEQLFKQIGCQYAKEIKVCHDVVLRESEPDMGYYGGGYWDQLFTDQCEYMQYTGLKDKNGKEIYEGDIVQHKYDFDDDPTFHHVGYGNWNCGCCGSVYGFGFGDHREDDVEVVGNIYETPELLKR